MHRQKQNLLRFLLKPNNVFCIFDSNDTRKNKTPVSHNGGFSFMLQPLIGKRIAYRFYANTLTKEKGAIVFCNPFFIALFWWAPRESNTAPTDYESAALTKHELGARFISVTQIQNWILARKFHYGEYQISPQQSESKLTTLKETFQFV